MMGAFVEKKKRKKGGNIVGKEELGSVKSVY
jgi:hypothetical protein